jgi:hypothetical protein
MGRIKLFGRFIKIAFVMASVIEGRIYGKNASVLKRKRYIFDHSIEKSGRDRLIALKVKI